MVDKFILKNDPYAKREAEKYGNPIPSREYIMEIMQERKKPVTFRYILKELGIDSEEEKEALRRRLRAMERDGQIMQNRRRSYCLMEKVNLIQGHVSGHKEGFGFVIADDTHEKFFITPREMQNVMDGDVVRIRPASGDFRGRRSASIVEVVSRNTQHVVGRFVIEDRVGFVVPVNNRITHDIIIPEIDRKQVKEGQMVVAEIIKQPSEHNQPIGKIVEVLGEHMAPGMEIEVAIRAYDIPHYFPLPVHDEAQQLPKQVLETDIEGRTDLRHLPFITIDGEDAKDFDDAVFCEVKEKGGWRLCVAIADVSHYVKPDSALDVEAKARGNSVYFPGKVVPMLPEALSNGLCSLNPNVDRLTMVCDMSVSDTGKVLHYRFYEAVINSHARMTYTNVYAIIQKNKKIQKQYQAIVPNILELYQLYLCLHKSREKRGAIDFDTVESRIVFGKDRKIKEIVPVIRNDAHRLIEECMLLANVSAADFLIKNKMPALFRNHEEPKLDDIEGVREYLKGFGLYLKGGKNPKPEDYARVLAEMSGRMDKPILQMVLLRSLSQAEYYHENEGHFGLAYKAYTHFTSPIRRYPDLLVHRGIRHILHHDKVENYLYNSHIMAQLGEHCSLTERRADEATRDATDWLKCEFMLDKLGQEFDGIVMGVTGFGLFVELKEFYIQGLVHITALPNDYYVYDEIKHCLVGERTRRVFRLGDAVRILVSRVDMDDKQIDFDLVK